MANSTRTFRRFIIDTSMLTQPQKDQLDSVHGDEFVVLGQMHDDPTKVAAVRKRDSALFIDDPDQVFISEIVGTPAIWDTPNKKYQSSFVGDGTASRAIICGFRPSMVTIIKSDTATSSQIIKMDSMTTSECLIGTTIENAVTITDTGFTVDGSANTNLKNYHFYAIE